MPLGLLLFIAIFLLVLIVIYNVTKTNFRSSIGSRVRRQCQEIAPSETIFVSIPEYRDSEAAFTICNLFARAYCPFHVYVGVCSQRTTGVDSDLMKEIISIATAPSAHRHGSINFTDHVEAFLREHVRVETVQSVLAKGPVIARASIERNLYKGQKYIMMIDSHMRFRDNWDKTAMENLNRCDSPKPILTMYPAHYISMGNQEPDGMSEKNPAGPPTCLFACDLTDKGIVGLQARQCAFRPSKPLVQLFWTPCFSFTYATAHQEVPYDPHLRYLFYGEEISMTARLWTAGWDFFCPQEMLLRHNWDSSYRPSFKELNKSAVNAEQRVQALLGIRATSSLHPNVTSKLEKYGLGNRRSLAAYEQFADLNFANHFLGQRAKFGLSPYQGSDNEEMLCKIGSGSL